MFAFQISNNVLLLSETKLSDTFPTAQSLQDGFKTLNTYRITYRMLIYNCSKGGDIILYVLFRLLTEYKVPECIFVESV